MGTKDTEDRERKEAHAKFGGQPYVTPQMVEQQVIREAYYIFPDTTVTVCCLYLLNGYTVIGESTCISQTQFDHELGRQIAYKKALLKIWPLLGYALADAQFLGQSFVSPIEDISDE